MLPDDARRCFLDGLKAGNHEDEHKVELIKECLMTVPHISKNISFCLICKHFILALVAVRHVQDIPKELYYNLPYCPRHTAFVFHVLYYKSYSYIYLPYHSFSEAGRQLMHLLASICPFVCALLLEPIDP